MSFNESEKFMIEFTNSLTGKRHVDFCTREEDAQVLVELSGDPTAFYKKVHFTGFRTLSAREGKLVQKVVNSLPLEQRKELIQKWIWDSKKEETPKC